jgi:hypothetical protein
LHRFRGLTKSPTTPLEGGLIAEFDIDNHVCHNDTTSASVYAEYNNKTSEGINITFGHSLIGEHHYLGYTQPVGEYLKYIAFSKADAGTPIY